MRTIKILGGLGNQMFQYALMIGLQEANQEEVFADISGFKKYHLHNGLELERVFPIRLHIAEKSPLWANKLTLSRYINKYLPFLCGNCQFEYPDFKFVEDIYNPQSNKTYYAGYWHHHGYVDPIREKLLEVFQFSSPKDEKNIEAISHMTHENSVGIHVRRGDYLKEKQYQGICSIDYYAQGVELFKEKNKDITFYVFSNDMRWCKENLAPLLGKSKMVYVDWNKGEESYRDMQLMTYCKGLIIANSSFSWWGAFLNQRQNHVVVAPKRWKNAKYDLNIQMTEWILI